MSVLEDLLGPGSSSVLSLLGDKSLPPEARARILKDLVQQLYGTYADQVRPVLPLLPELADQLAADIAVLPTMFLTLMDGVTEEEVARAAMRRHDKVFAERKKERYDALCDAGFSEQQAFALLLQGMARSPVAQAWQDAAKAADRTSAAGGTRRRSPK